MILTSLQQLAAVTATSIEVYDMKTLQRVERAPFKPRSLIQDAGSGPQAEDDVFTNASLDIVRSVKSYKGKLFLLVCNPPASAYRSDSIAGT